MQFADVKAFLVKWGLDPNNPAQNDLSESQYRRLLESAHELYGDTFARFIVKIVDKLDGRFFLSHERWDDVQDQWNYWCRSRE